MGPVSSKNKSLCPQCSKLDQKPKDDNECVWWINSAKHDNCLWQYVNSMSGPDGSMPELVQSEIAQLLGWSNTKTHFMLKQAVAELVEALKAHHANKLLDPDPDQIVDVSSYDLEVSPIPSEDGDE